MIFIASGIFGLLHKYLLDISQPYEALAELHVQNQNVSRDTVSIGVVSRFPPNLIYKGYQPLIDYLNDNDTYYFSLVISHSYSDTVDKLANGTVNAAFLGSYIYVQSRDIFDIRPILKPRNQFGGSSFQSVIVTRNDSNIESLQDLYGTRIALPSPDSYAANWLFENNTTPSFSTDDFAVISHQLHHQNVIYEIMRGNFDAGSVKDRVANEFIEQGIKIVAKSESIPGSPIVTGSDYHPAIDSLMVTKLLNLYTSTNAEGTTNVIRELDPEFQFGFTKAESSDYDEMATRLNLN